MSIPLVKPQYLKNEEGLDIVVFRGFLRGEEALELFEELLEIEYNKDSHVVIFGKKIAVPRLQVAFGDEGTSYKFSGVKVDARPWPSSLDAFREALEEVLKEQKILPASAHISFVLVNQYRDGNDCIGAHSDDEADLARFGKGPIIASLSLGATRTFIFTHKETRKKMKMTLNHGDLLIMREATNKHFKHEVPREAVEVFTFTNNEVVRETTARINLTFRVMSH